MDDKKFRYLVADMLERQQAYFKERKQSDLIESKKLERQVREALKEFDAAEHGKTVKQAALDLEL